jgi:aminopeptidase N
MGFPVINVQSKSEDGSKTLTLTQEKFNADGSKSTGYLWAVPISILTSKGNF